MKKTILIMIMAWTWSLAAQTANPDKPQNGSWDMAQKQLWQTDQAGGNILGSIQNLVITPSGQMAVLDSKEAVIHLFSPEGRHLARFGKRGEGPGEFKTLNRGQQIYAVGKELLFFENARLLHFDSKGTFIRHTALPTRLDPSAFIDENRFISAPSTSDNPKAEIPLELYDFQKNTGRILASFKPYSKATASNQNAQRSVTVAIVIGDITPLMMVAAGNNHLVYGMSDRYELTRIDFTGKVLNTFSIPGRKANKVSQKFKDQLKKNLPGNAPSDLVQRILDGLPPEASFFSNIQVMENGLILTFVSDPDRTDGVALDLFSPEGRYLYQAEFSAPDGHTIDTYTLSSDRLFMATQDEDGTPWLTCFQITLPKG